MISSTVRAQVISELLTGASINQTAKKYKLSTSTVSAIRGSLGTATQEENRKRDGKETERNSAKSESLSINELVVKSLTNRLKMQEAITRVASDSDWLKRQTAEHLAKLLEVGDAYVLRLLEAASDAIENEDEEDS